jgi:hypothetical protein
MLQISHAAAALAEAIHLAREALVATASLTATT